MAVHKVVVEDAQIAGSVLSNEVDAAGSLLAFFHHLSSKEDEESQPPRKRQRTGRHNQDHHSSADGSREQDSDTDRVSLADNALTLITSRVADVIPVDESDISVPVFICSQSSQNNYGGIRVVVSGVGKKRQHSISISLTAQNAKEEIVKHITHAVTASKNMSSAASQRSRAFWCQCTLSAPSDIEGDARFFKLSLKLYWKPGLDTAVAQTKVAVRSKDEILSAYFPSESARDSTPWSPQDFYSNVHIPDPKDEVSSAFTIPDLTSELYPFQLRAVRWLLQQEGKSIDDSGTIVPFDNTDPVPLSFRLCKNTSNQPFYVSRLLQEVQTVEQMSRMLNRPLNGGILAEEMGLGKTVELLALICLNRSLESSRKMIDPYTNSSVVTSGATLIISPPSILEQWKNELATHAPGLKVWHYEGIKQSELQDKVLKEKLLQQDVVLATYGVLAREIHFADEKPDRNLRHTKVYKPRRSPLVQIYWWRVCLDEAQMVESGVSNAATVARMIPRDKAWAVSGTPLRKDVQDLFGLLRFLRYEPFCSPLVWNRMISSFKDVFAELFGKIALRHTKSSICNELQIPPQKRVVITVPFTAIEEQHYTHLFQQMCDDCGLDNEGGPLRADWNPYEERVVEKMRSWLTRLRQTCLHAEVGIRNRRALGHRDGPLRTVDEVLDVMMDQNETALRGEERTVLMSKVMQGHLQSFGKETSDALKVYSEALEQSNIIVRECREQLAEEKLKADQDEIDREVKPEVDGTLENEEEDEGKENRHKLQVCRQRLRWALEVQHVCVFFAATSYFQLKEAEGKRIGYEAPSEKVQDSQAQSDTSVQGNGSNGQGEENSGEVHKTTEPSQLYKDFEKQESESYEVAKSIRRELLAAVSKKALDLMRKLSRSSSSSLVHVPRVEAFENFRGIESRKIKDSIERMRWYLNEHAAQLETWRQKLVDLLSVRLLDQDEDIEISGEEYEASTKQQDEQYVYFEAFRAAIADRHCMVTGQVNELIKHEMKQAYRLAKNGKAENPEDRGHAPEVMLEVWETRSKLLPPADAPQSLQHIMSDVRSMLTSVQWQQGSSSRAGAEVQILERELANLQEVSSIQSKNVLALEKELDLVRSTMNQRLEFYRLLQHISDMVAPLQEEMSEEVDAVRLNSEIQKETLHAEKLANLKTKRRFLAHLKEESSGKQEQRICVICQSPFEIGVLTVCGHQYCKECIKLWWSEHRNCPMCKKHLKLSDFHEITYKPREIRAQEEIQSSSPDEASPASPSKTSIYSDIPESTLNEIKSINVEGSFGTKIDTLARHLLWIRENDPGAKSIIFSQYRDFLQVLARAFGHFKIGYSEIGSKQGIQRFREDPSVECFLLHAKADSSGLNLVNATHVFLCEPLINAAIELQAIARVHRIGQRRSTTVWMYLVNDTVEEAIYDISVSRRLSHMHKAAGSSSRNHSRSVTPAFEEKTLDAANSIELQAAPISRLLTKGQSGGEVVENDDLWSCLFSKPRRRQRAGMDSSLEDAGGQEVGRFLRAEAAERRRVEEMS